MKAINLITDTEYEFDKNTTPEWAVRYGYASENNRLSELFSLCQNGECEEIEKRFPVVRGKVSVCIGDICAMIK